MKEELSEIVRQAGNPVQGRNLAREYLQVRILLALQEAGAMIPLAFQRGTALRFLFGLPRFSEDLDFALERPEHSERQDAEVQNREPKPQRDPAKESVRGNSKSDPASQTNFNLDRLGKRVTSQLNREGYEVTTKLSTERTVNTLMVGFTGLLHELGLSPHDSQRLRIRIDVDTRPPKGAVLTTTVVRRHAMLNLQHHDRSSLLAGKIHAILQRTWTKGRDLFDLFWYLSDPDWPAPNLDLLNNALLQTGWEQPLLEKSDWRRVVRSRLETLDWKAAERDVSPFLEAGPEGALFTRENVIKLL